MNDLFKKYIANPILSPSGTDWESMAVMTPAVIVENGVFYMIYRGDDWTWARYERKQQLPAYLAKIRSWKQKKRGGWAHLGLAISCDGINFERYSGNPIMTPQYKWEKPWGCEDPRIIRIKETYVLTYRAGGAQIALATSKDLINWDKKGIALPSWNSTNSGAILSERVKGKYVMYHGDSNIWVAYSEDLLNWRSPREPIMTPREGYFDSELVEPGPPPIMTEDGILLIYHGKNKATQAYCLGKVLFSKDDPSRILYRSSEPILQPTKEWEINGKEYNVIFSTGLVNYQNTWYLYYGGADTHIGVAMCNEKI